MDINMSDGPSISLWGCQTELDSSSKQQQTFLFSRSATYSYLNCDRLDVMESVETSILHNTIFVLNIYVLVWGWSICDSSLDLSPSLMWGWLIPDEIQYIAEIKWYASSSARLSGTLCVCVWGEWRQRGWGLKRGQSINSYYRRAVNPEAECIMAA